MSLLDISKKIKYLLENKKFTKDLEIEAKIKNINVGDFEMLSDYLKTKYASEESFTIDYYDEADTRITEIDDKFYNTSKKSIFREATDHSKNFIKFGVSTEENFLLNIKNFENYKLKREKNRTTYYDQNLKFDMTEVKELPSNIISYEFEIEVINPDIFDPIEFSDSIKNISVFISSYRSDIIRFCNISLSENRDNRDDEIKYYLISKLRDLKKKDIASKNSILRGFNISIKADGIQYFLLFHKSGIWLVSHTKENIRICGLTEEYSHLENSLFVGEIVNKENILEGKNIDSKCIFLPFDTISYKSKSVVNKKYSERCEYFKEIISKYIYCNGVKKIKIVGKKIFYLGVTSKSFYKGFKECCMNRDEIIYKDDGYVFTPENSPYVAEGQNKKQWDRILDKNLDVCKFKHIENRSIDFKVMKGELYYKQGKGLRLFNELEHEMDFKEDLEGKIVEFFPLFLEDERVILKPERIRSDKIWPNTEAIVLEIVNSYFEKNPVTEKTLLGKDTVLMRDFNNKIKEDLIKEIGGYVVDIGAGKGGDIRKFGKNKKIKRVLSIEPNPEFYNEFEIRLKESKWSSKFVLLKKTKGEDSDKINENLIKFLPENMEGENLTITFMISLSFFWSSEEILNSLARTLNEIKEIYKSKGGNRDVDVVFFTIDGNKVEEMFRQHGKDSIQLNTIRLSRSEENQVMVDIEDSKTVFNQIEYLVKLDELFHLAGMEKVFLKNPKIDKDLLMSTPEKLYISLFVFGKYKMTKDPNFSYKLTRIDVNVKKGVLINDKVLAKGDDVFKSITFLGENIYRIGTMDLNMSLSNSILKLTNKEYRDGDVHERIRLAKILHSEIKNKKLDEVSEIIDFGIKIFDGKESIKFGKDKEKWIILNKCLDRTYEPIIYKTDLINYTFLEESWII